jgi:hypothetical protein
MQIRAEFAVAIAEELIRIDKTISSLSLLSWGDRKQAADCIGTFGGKFQTFLQGKVKLETQKLNRLTW